MLEQADSVLKTLRRCERRDSSEVRAAAVRSG